VETAARKPSATTIEPIYLLLKGTGRLLLQVLSQDVLANFQETIMNILREGAGLSDQCLSLYCLSIMTVFAAAESGSGAMSSGSTGDFLASTSNSSNQRSDVLEQFLSGSRAPKTVQLIVLVVLAASRGIDTGANANKSLILANEVICAIPAEIRGKWCIANAAVVRKLQEKASAGDETDPAQLLTLRFVANLCGSRMLSDRLFARIEATFTDPSCVRTANMLLDRKDGLDTLADIVHRGKVESLILSAIGYATSADMLDVVCLNAFTEIMQGVLTIGNDETTSTRLFTPSLMNGLLRLKRRLDALTDDPEKTGGQHRGRAEGNTIGSCVYSTRQAVATFVQATSRLLLEIRLASSDATSTSASTQSLILDLYSQASKADPPCQHKSPTTSRSLEFVEQSATQDLSSTDWRSIVKARLGREADTVIQSIGKACAGLEARCENVEQPLKEANEKYRHLEQQNAEMSSAFAQIEAINIDLGIQNHALEDERDQNRREADDNRNIVEELTRHISDLKDNLAAQEGSSHQRLQELENTIAERTVSHLAALAGKESMLEDLRDRIASFENVMTVKESAIIKLHETIEMMRSEAEGSKTSLEKALDDRNHLAEANKQEVSLLNELVQQLRENVATYIDEAGSLKTDLERTTAERDNLSTDLESTRAQIQRLEQVLSEAQQEKANLEQSHEEAITTITRKLESVRKASVGSLVALRAEFDEAKSTIAHLQSHVQHLQAKCDRKSAQITEANVLRSNLLAAMGVPASAVAQQSGLDAPHNFPTTLAHRSRSPSVSFTGQQSFAAPQHASSAQQQQDPDFDRSPLTPTSSTSFSDDLARVPPSQRRQHLQAQPPTNPVTVSFASATSASSGASNSTQHGPTPKRARPRRSTAQQQKPSSPTKTRNSMGPTTAPSSSFLASWTNAGASRRQTLGVLTTAMMEDEDDTDERNWT
jgi:predicted  nucleic acid-binding Zn-ribbon protein